MELKQNIGPEEEIKVEEVRKAGSQMKKIKAVESSRVSIAAI